MPSISAQFALLTCILKYHGYKHQTQQKESAFKITKKYIPINQSGQKERAEELVFSFKF